MFDNLYCKIFIDTDCGYDKFFEKIKSVIGGQKQAVSFINSNWCIMSIRKNKEYISESNDFLYWKYFIDIEPQNVPESTYIEKIRQFVYFLKRRNSVVCVCDFEEYI